MDYVKVIYRLIFDCLSASMPPDCWLLPGFYTLSRKRFLLLCWRCNYKLSSAFMKTRSYNISIYTLILAALPRIKGVKNLPQPLFPVKSQFSVDQSFIYLKLLPWKQKECPSSPSLQFLLETFQSASLALFSLVCILISFYYQWEL